MHRSKVFLPSSTRPVKACNDVKRFNDTRSKKLLQVVNPARQQTTGKDSCKRFSRNCSKFKQPVVPHCLSGSTPVATNLLS